MSKHDSGVYGWATKDELKAVADQLKAKPAEKEAPAKTDTKKGAPAAKADKKSAKSDKGEKKSGKKAA